MRILPFCCPAALGPCAAEPEPMDWQAWLAAERSVGPMRDDPAPPDAPFDDATVARNFRTIAPDVEGEPFLYDPRLEPGMTPGTAMPVLNEIIAELRPPA